MDQLINLIITLLAFFVLISLLVFVHELGHFLAAKYFKVYVREFAIGFGKTIWSKQWRGTKYALRLVPLGGFVELEGEVSANEGPNAFRNKRAYQKIIILMAGVFMNIVFATIAFAIFLPTNGYKFNLPAIADYSFSNTKAALKVFPVTVITVDDKGQSVGQLSSGDTIIGVDGKRFQSYPAFQQALKDVQEKTVKFEFVDLDTFETSERDIKVGKADDKGAILNVSLNFDRSQPYPIYLLRFNENVTSAASLTGDTSIYLLKSLGGLLGNAFKTGDYTEVAQSVGGLPKLADNVGQVVEYRAYEILIPLAALISISLAIFNILPFPALDGGQAAVVLFETLTRRKVSDRVLGIINTVGFFTLIGLAIVVNFKDVIQLGWLNSIGDFFKNILGR
ncbi:MAG: site-2 protease family protein [Candidatus Dojkabacteria bacterium]